MTHSRIVAAAFVLATASAAAFGNTYTVTSTADSGAGTLRQTILDAKANAGPDTTVRAIRSCASRWRSSS